MGEASGLCPPAGGAVSDASAPDNAEAVEVRRQPPTTTSSPTGVWPRLGRGPCPGDPRSGRNGHRRPEAKGPGNRFILPRALLDFVLVRLLSTRPAGAAGSGSPQPLQGAPKPKVSTGLARADSISR